MGDSYRIRTEIGINKTINVELEQDFKFLEILSLKIQQEDVYNKSCSNYGVVVGRVTANNGYGIPNAKVSVFVPIDETDKQNPQITAIYPYTSPEEKNDDGYRYNLLPYESTHSNHVPTGTFPSRMDALTDPVAIEIYNKYYKFTVKTNESGDYMIFGVPLGIQTIFLDVDLSDIGEFSLTPQDLIRMGRATEAQVSGSKFRSSTDLNSLPQILSLTKSAEVSPLWGDPDICQIAINRIDFDLRDDANIDIQPTSVFMGSLVSSDETLPLKNNCKPSKKLGELCSLVAGPGEILSIRQTIFQDEYGRPILEQYNFDGGNNVIDTDGSWLVDLPMNLDYVTINEFGEKVLSNDPKIGIPTKGKYRFKVKWKQPNDLSVSTKRGYFLVPNIRENGWVSPYSDPRKSPGTVQYDEFVQSYAFSLDWSDYGDTGTTRGRQIIQTAIDCEDRFYPFAYNKVYTVSSMIDLWQKGTNRNRFIGIKNITDTTCESSNYKFPTNDSYKAPDLLLTIINLLVYLGFQTFLMLIPILHILAAIWPIFKILIIFVYVTVMGIIYGICRLIDLIPGVNPNCVKPKNPGDLWDKLGNPFSRLSIPMITYPECEMCECKVEEVDGTQTAAFQFALAAQQNSSFSCLIDSQGGNGFSDVADQQYCADDPFLSPVSGASCSWITNDDPNCAVSLAPAVQELMAGNGRNYFYKRTPAPVEGVCNNISHYMLSQDLTLSERLNLFNTKGKFFNNIIGNQSASIPNNQNPYGGWNQVKVSIRPDLNAGQFHFDNVTVLLVDNGCSEYFTTGKILSFNQSDFSKDVNLTGATTTTYVNFDGDLVSTNSTTGTPKNISQITVNYADPNDPTGSSFGTPKTYLVDQTSAISQILIPNSEGQITTFTYDSQAISAANTGTTTYNNVVPNPTTNPSIGTGATFNVDVVNGSVTNVTLNNSGYGYVTDIILLILGSQIGGQDGFDDVYITPTNVTAGQYTTGIVQKFATDIEYFQVITATTFGEFISLNPQVTNSQYNIPYNNSNTGNHTPEYNSLRYRFTDNFMSFWKKDYGTISVPIIINGTVVGQYTTNGYKYSTDDTYRPIYTMPDQKEFVMIFLMRGVDPHSARQKMDIDISKLFGKNYGNVVVSSDYKLNIPIQPGLALPRHNKLINNEGTSMGHQIFFDSYVYDTPSSFLSYNTNLVANYSALDSDCFTNFSDTLSPFQIDGTSGTQLISGMVRVSQNALCANQQTNVFAQQTYVVNGGSVVNAGAYSNSGYQGINNPNYLDLNGDKQHRGYYDYEYIEGGSYFFMSPNNPNTKDITPESYKYFSPVYTSGVSINFLQGTKKVVMRTDRLPSSTSRNATQGNNTFVLHQNNTLSFQVYTDDGISQVTYQSATGGAYLSGDNIEDGLTDFEASLASTFTCAGLTPLDCYSGDGLNFGVKPTGDDCYNKPAQVTNGCYVFVRNPIILSIPRDYKALGEWISRFRVNLAACRGVFSHVFNNNWINGTLFAYPIRNKRLFDGNNQPYNKYCKDTVMLHPTTNNFYYRSSPYNVSSGKFTGFIPNNSTHRNRNQILFPTTIMDMGPRDEFAYELTLSENYYGYNMQNMNSTTYQDVSNLLNLFIISRQISSSFLQQILNVGNGSVASFFSRPNARVDGDYAQMISINSELGVDEFDFEEYNFSTTGSSTENTYFVGNKIFGVFFSSNTQTRDYVTPRRIIRNDNIPGGLYDNLPIFSQIVPMYEWRINLPGNSNSIFGTDRNEWATTQQDIQLQTFRYQEMDRTKLQYNYFMGQTNLPIYLKGYIYNIQYNGSTYGFQPFLNGQLINQQRGSYTVGAPFHFYFGLKRGNSALDKFNVKYLGVEII